MEPSIETRTDSWHAQNQFSLAPGNHGLHAESKHFPRELRLTRPREFQRVFKQACFKSQDKCYLVLALDSDTPFARLGMTVAKKKIASAVERNRARRLLRESFRQNRQKLDKLDIVVVVRNGADKLSNEEVFSSLNRHWNKLAEQVRKK